MKHFLLETKNRLMRIFSLGKNPLKPHIRRFQKQINKDGPMLPEEIEKTLLDEGIKLTNGDVETIYNELRYSKRTSMKGLLYEINNMKINNVFRLHVFVNRGMSEAFKKKFIEKYPGWKEEVERHEKIHH